MFTGGLAKPFDLEPGGHYRLRAMELDGVDFDVTAPMIEAGSDGRATT